MQDDITCIWGGRGSGKTTLSRKLIDDMAPPRVLFIDPMSPTGIAAYDVGAALQNGGTRLVMNDPSRTAQQGALLTAYLASTPANPVYIVCDEAPSYLDKETEALRKVMYQGRHAGCGILILGQRPAAVASGIRSQASRTYWMRLTDHRDLQTAKETIGKDADTLPGFAPGQYKLSE